VPPEQAAGKIMSPQSLQDSTDLTPVLEPCCDASHWYVGFSGGLDSTALLHLLMQWCANNASAPALTAIHVNHGMQASASDWQSHCVQICAEWQVPLITRKVEVAEVASPEAAARKARYDAFEAVLEPGSVLFLGHHLDDQVETFFLRLMRGAGVQGLAAMPVKRALGEGRLVRPLLQVSRDELETYVASAELSYIEDPSNADTAIDRNFMRQEVLPLLASRWPAYRATVTRASGHMASAAAALAQAQPEPPTLYSKMGDPGMALEHLAQGQGNSGALRLRSWLLSLGLQAPDTAALDELLRQLHGASEDAAPKLSSASYALQRYREALYLLPDLQCAAPAVFINLGCGESAFIPGVGTVSLEQTKGAGLQLSADDVLRVSWRSGGEECRLMHREGSSSLKKLLQGWGIPPWWRDRVPLLYLDDELLAIADLALCQSSRQPWEDGLGEADSATGKPRWKFVWKRLENAPCD
jgi:tRNA(Ile)-lysidine synthase